MTKYDSHTRSICCHWESNSEQWTNRSLWIELCVVTEDGKAGFQTRTHCLFCSHESRLQGAVPPLPSSPLLQASRARQTRPGVQSICLDKCGDLGPRQSYAGTSANCLCAKELSIPWSLKSLHSPRVFVRRVTWTWHIGPGKVEFSTRPTPRCPATQCNNVIVFSFFILNVHFRHPRSLFLSHALSLQDGWRADGVGGGGAGWGGVGGG